MGRPNIFQITLSNEESTYYAGQNVEGHVTVELTEDMVMRGVFLHFKGQAKVSWSETETSGHGQQRTTETITKTNRENCFSHTIRLIGSSTHYGNEEEDDQENVTLPQGRHTFPFAFPLPADTPSSFIGKYGSVCYLITAKISRPWKSDLVVEKGFFVMALLDLSLDPQAESPEEKEKEVMVCCMCCESGPITAQFSLKRVGHIPGEYLQFRAAVQNNSRRSVDLCDIMIDVVSTFYADSDEKRGYAKECRIEMGTIEAGKSATWIGAPDQLVIPRSLSPSGMPGCSIIDVKYHVTLSVYPSCDSPMLLTLPLTIGTIPSRYAVTGDPPVPCRPLTMTPQVGYTAPPPPGMTPLDSGVGVGMGWKGGGENKGRPQPSAPPMSEEGPGGEGSASLHYSGGAGPSAYGASGGASAFPDDVAGEPPPSYAEYMEMHQLEEKPKCPGP